MLIGALTGALFGLLAPAGSFDTTFGLQLAGFVAGGACGGLGVGTLAKMFRRRLTAGLAAWFSASLGLYVANRAWQEIPEPDGVIFAGLCCAIVYAVLFWDYKPVDVPSDNGEEPPAANG
jgi:predicted lipid-binding transport protein (Tim44 family)